MLLVFLSPSLLSCLAERVSIHLTDFDGDEAHGTDVSGSLSTVRPDLNTKQVYAKNVLDYVLHEGRYAERQNKFAGENKDFYSELVKHLYSEHIEDYDYSKGRKRHQEEVLSHFRLIIGRLQREDRSMILKEKKRIMQGDDEEAKANVENLGDKYPKHAQFVTGLPGALRPVETEAALVQLWGGLATIYWDDVVVLCVGNAELFKRASEAGAINDDMLQDASEVWPQILEHVRKRHVNALFVSPRPVDYESEVKPFVEAERPNNYASVDVAYTEIGCDSSEEFCSFGDKASRTGEGVTADEVFNARKTMIDEAIRVKAEGGVQYKLMVVNDAGPKFVPLDEQPTDREQADILPLTYKDN